MRKTKPYNNVSELNLNEIAALAMKEFGGSISYDLWEVLVEIHVTYPDTVPVEEESVSVSEKNLSYDWRHLCKEAEIVLILWVKLGNEDAFARLLLAKKYYLHTLAEYIHTSFVNDKELLDNSMENWCTEIYIAFWRHILQLPERAPGLLKSTTGFDLKSKNSPLYKMRISVLKENYGCRYQEKYISMLYTLNRLKKQSRIEQLTPEETEYMLSKFYTLPKDSWERNCFIRRICNKVNGTGNAEYTVYLEDVMFEIQEMLFLDSGFELSERELSRYHDKTLREIAGLFTEDSRVADIVVPLAAKDKWVLIYLDSLYNSQKPGTTQRINLKYIMDKYGVSHDKAKSINKAAIKTLRRELACFKKHFPQNTEQ